MFINKKNLIMFMPTIDTGGVEKNFIIISNHFAITYKNVSVITTSAFCKNKFSKKINFITQNLINLQNMSRRSKFAIALLILFKELILNKNNLVFCFQANLYCILLCKILNTKIIVRSNSSPTGWSSNNIKKYLYKVILRLADKIVVNSLEFKKVFKKKFNIDVECIYNPLNKKDVLKLSKKKIKFNFFNKKNINFINVSRLETQKDHFTLLKSLKNIHYDYKLLLIGNGSKKVDIERYIKNHNLSENIKILSNIDNPFPYIKKADYLILSSIYEGLPNILLEAIVLKKLIISSDCPTGPKEILDNGRGGILFKTGNHQDLIKKLNSLKKDYKINKKKMRFAFKRINRFDYNEKLLEYTKLTTKFLTN
jgi:glycosyltransferase involved in cell wall biosynthesis